MARVLAFSVVVPDETAPYGEVMLKAGTEVPEWAEDLIHNPKAFVDDELEAAEDPVAPVRRGRRKSADDN